MAMVLSTQCRLVGALCVALMALSGLLVASLSGWLDPNRNKRALDDDPELKVARLRQPEFETEQLTVLCILFIIIVVGNSAVLITLTMSKSRKSRMNFFIKHLALADLAVGLINVLTDIVWRITITWYAGNAACKFIRFLQAVVTYASTYVLVALSIDRYDAITHPMNFSGSWRRARILVSIAWLLSLLFSLPTVFLFEEKPIEGQMQCWIDLEPWQWKVYMTLISVALFVLPALIISACYTIIVRTIWSKSKLLLVPPATVGIVQPHTAAAVNGPDERILRHRHLRDDLHDCRRASSRGIIPKAKIKTVKMTFVIVFVFVLCWSPYIIFDLLQVYDHIPRTQTNIAIATFVQSLAPLNSAANPVIYCLFSTHMCRSLKNLPPFKWFICCLTICIPSMMDESRGVNAHCLGCNDNNRADDSENPMTHRGVRYRMRTTSGTRTTSSRDSTRTTASSLIALSSVTRRSSSVTSLRQHAVRRTGSANQMISAPPGGSTPILPTIQQNRQKIALSIL